MVDAKSSGLLKYVFCLVLLLLASAGLFCLNFIYLPKKENCPFTNVWVCFTGKKYEKNQWKGKLAGEGFRFKKPQKILAPFDGKFLFSAHTNINFENKNLGVVYALSFKDEKNKEMGLLMNKASLLKGNIAEWQVVKKGEMVAEVYPEGISFLDNFSVIKLGPIE